MTQATPKHRGQRPSKTPPQVSIRHLREVAGLSLEQVAARIYHLTGRRHGKGTLSAVENGMRGASAELLEDLQLAYGLPPGAITTDYIPKARRGKSDEVAAA